MRSKRDILPYHQGDYWLTKLGTLYHHMIGENIVPNILTFMEVQADEVAHDLALIMTDGCVLEDECMGNSPRNVSRRTFLGKEETLIYLDADHDTVSIFYSDKTSKKYLSTLQKKIQAHSNIKETGKINMISRDPGGLKLIEFDVNKSAVDIDAHYNDDFIPFNKKILKWLDNGKKGIVIMHGMPGTGKSTYLRYLCHHTSKRMIYIPPDMTSVISDPDFIGFISEHVNSVLIIEDAENVLKSRSSGGTQAMSNLLNMSDGLLSDCLQLQIICTFNSDLNAVDKALLRPGRLEAKYEFGELSDEKVARLVKKHKLKFKVRPATLAEVFNDAPIVGNKDKGGMGFDATNS